MEEIGEALTAFKTSKLILISIMNGETS